MDIDTTKYSTQYQSEQLRTLGVHVVDPDFWWLDGQPVRRRISGAAVPALRLGRLTRKQLNTIIIKLYLIRLQTKTEQYNEALRGAEYADTCRHCFRFN